jgi:hypothetical protein
MVGILFMANSLHAIEIRNASLGQAALYALHQPFTGTSFKLCVLQDPHPSWGFVNEEHVPQAHPGCGFGKRLVSTWVTSVVKPTAAASGSLGDNLISFGAFTADAGDTGGATGSLFPDFSAADSFVTNRLKSAIRDSIRLFIMLVLLAWCRGYRAQRGGY